MWGVRAAWSYDHICPSVETFSLGTMLELPSNLGSGQWSADKLKHTEIWNALKLDMLCCPLVGGSCLVIVKIKTRCKFIDLKGVSATCHWLVFLLNAWAVVGVILPSVWQVQAFSYVAMGTWATSYLSSNRRSSLGLTSKLTHIISYHKDSVHFWSENKIWTRESLFNYLC